MDKVVTLIAVNKKGEVLAFLRDDIPDIKYPGKWDLLGGHIEEGESPEEAIEREIKEEIEVNIARYMKFRYYEWEDQIEHVYFMVLDLDLNETPCNEGQRLDYFSKEEIMNMDLAFHHNQILEDFFEEFPKFKSVLN
tara:strand:+ start:3868 stop:4278 length:411 start_codon:yes stop_codon:yes gene_type:complete